MSQQMAMRMQANRWGYPLAYDPRPGWYYGPWVPMPTLPQPEVRRPKEKGYTGIDREEFEPPSKDAYKAPQILREKARDTDLVARYGGEEFALIMPETDGKGALVIAERIREAVQAKVFQTELGPLQVTLSLGIAAAPANGADKQALIDLADQCLYFAKRNGRNRSVLPQQMESSRRSA